MNGLIIHCIIVFRLVDNDNKPPARIPIGNICGAETSSH